MCATYAIYVIKFANFMVIVEPCNPLRPLHHSGWLFPSNLAMVKVAGLPLCDICFCYSLDTHVKFSNLVSLTCFSPKILDKIQMVLFLIY